MSPYPSPRKVNLVGSRIRELRKGHHLTQTELSDKIGIAQSDLSRMEQGEYKVGLDTLLKVLQTFDLSIGDFFEEGNHTQTVIERYRTLSPSAQREVESFIEFKRKQEEGSWDSDEGDGGGGDV